MHSQITLYKQIHPKQCDGLAKLGFKSLINLRFDDEIKGQPKGYDKDNPKGMTSLKVLKTLGLAITLCPLVLMTFILHKPKHSLI